MVDGIDIYFNIGGHTYNQNFKDISLALSFIRELDSLGLSDGGSCEKGLLIGCRESKRYGINIWENFSQRRIPKNDLEKLAKQED